MAAPSTQRREPMWINDDAVFSLENSFLFPWGLGGACDTFVRPLPPRSLVRCAACVFVLVAAFFSSCVVLGPIALAPLTTLSAQNCDAACAHARLVADARARVVRTCSLPPRFTSNRYGEGVRWRNVTDVAAAALGWVVERVGDGPGGSNAGCARSLSASDARTALAGKHVLFLRRQRLAAAFFQLRAFSRPRSMGSPPRYGHGARR